MKYTKESDPVLKEIRIKKEAEWIANSTVNARRKEEAMSDEEIKELFDTVYKEQLAKLTAKAE